MRERIKQFEDRDAQWLTVIAQDPFYIGGLPGGQVPYPVLADPAATVSATYGVAFQVNTAGSNGWANRPATFVIDREGVIRFVADNAQADLLVVLKELEEERSLIGALKAKGARLREAAARTLAAADRDTGVAVTPAACPFRPGPDRAGGRPGSG
ncbi:MAG: redoxin domain-containing protein [Planctomycetes bacterium]|nr:redoxin domain-containing protein [Planctomycetota bacterium]